MVNNYCKEALSQYGISCADIELIRHNENMTYCINHRYLLRIHKSKEGFHAMPYFLNLNIASLHEEELQFIQHLQAGGIYTQTPIYNIFHQLVTYLHDGTTATMLSWLPGRVLTKEDLTVSLCYELGSLLGKVHRRSALFHGNLKKMLFSMIGFCVIICLLYCMIIINRD